MENETFQIQSQRGDVEVVTDSVEVSRHLRGADFVTSVVVRKSGETISMSLSGGHPAELHKEFVEKYLGVEPEIEPFECPVHGTMAPDGFGNCAKCR